VTPAVLVSPASATTPPSVGSVGSALAGDAATTLERLGYRVLGYQRHDVHVVRYDAARHEQLWDSFLPQTVNGNLFQTRRFLKYHPPGRFVDHSLLFFDSDELLAVAAGEETEGRWSAHRFSSHGGLAILPGLRADRCLDAVLGLLRYATERGWRRLSMRFAPSYLWRGDLDVLHWALEICGFREQGKELAWGFLPGPRSEAELLAGYANGARGAVIKARKEAILTVRRSDDLPAYWRLLQRNLDTRFQVEPTHTLDEMLRIRSLCPHEVSLWGVFHPDAGMIAGALIFEVSATGAHTFYSAQDYGFHLLRSTSLLMHELCLEYVVRQQRCLNHGVITAHGAEELNLGLSWFKQSFGARPAVRRTFVYESPACPPE